MSTIFVSSTFQDMQQERDILQNSVLPRIKELAKQYGKNIDLCDLRWGVNSIGMSESESTAKVLQVCFDEIDNARPFFIAILGDRYGWIPDSSIVESSITGRNIDHTEMAGKSVTEMEILYGALKNSESSDVRFYFREITNKRRGLFLNPDLPKHFISENSDDKKRMRALKEVINARFPEQVRTYSVSWDKKISRLDGMEYFAETLYRDLEEMITRRWGPIPELSEYEYQLNQYQFAIDSDSYIANSLDDLLSSESHPDNLKLNESFMSAQNYVLTSRDEHSLNLLFSSLCKKYQSANATVVPYECSQSVLSSSTENMLLFFIHILAESISKDANVPTSAHDCDRLCLIDKFHAVLAQTDELLEHPMILAIRNIQYLDKDNIFDWFPLRKFKNIRFILSCDKIFPAPSQFKENTLEFYFQDNRIFSRNRLIKSYMARYHKELDNQVFFALLDKAKDKDDQYLELLMQRLLVLSQEDFEIIKNNGDGIDKISQYLQNIIAEAQNNTAEFISSQLTLLEKETDHRFVRAVLAILLLLPYGISVTDLSRVLKEGNVVFTTLDMTLLCRRFPSVVNVTLDGYYRVIHTPATNILSDYLVAEMTEWIRHLEHYMATLHTEDVLSGTEHASEGLYRSQYLEVALKSGKKTALAEYLKKVDYDVPYIALIIAQLLLKEGLNEALKENIRQLTMSDISWMASDLYDYLSDQKILLNNGFAFGFIDIWKTMLSCLNRINDSSEEKNYIKFKLLYELGEVAYLHNMDDASDYLIDAKSVSKMNFRQYPNRLWKKIHGIELSEKEKYQGYDGLGLNKNDGEVDPVMFGFHGEIEDMEFEQSWSDKVRVINNYLSHIYRKRGDVAAAEALEAESKSITHISDPDPHRKGENQLVPGITIIRPDEFDKDKVRKETIKKQPYKPDLRRNSAIQIAKEARKLQDEENREAAIIKYEESNEILMEIYEDGQTGEFYDMNGVVGNPYDIRVMIQKECARDIGLNINGIIQCVPIRENSQQLKAYLDEMLKWAQIYDDYRNNKQSKSDLEHYYLLSAEVYYRFQNAALYCDRILHAVDQYFTYRLEAHMKGEQTDERIMQDRVKANDILYQTVIENPQIGSQITDLLLRQSNATVKANDFNGFVQLTYLVENLFRWMRENNLDWVGTHCSLEFIFFSNIENQCMLWEQHQMTDRLHHDADRLVELLHHVRESRNALKGIQSVLRYCMLLFHSGEYQDAIPYADAILELLCRTSELPCIELASIYEKLLAMYSEAELFESAQIVAEQNIALLNRMEQTGYTEAFYSSNITPSQFQSFLVSKKIISYLNYAVALSRMENHEEAERYLCMADELSAEHPDVVSSESGILHRIALFRKNGLPKPKRNEDSEKAYRRHKNEIETALSKYLKGDPFDISKLQYVEKTIREMTDMPEHEIYKNPYSIAKYYHVLSMLYASLDRKDLAVKMLTHAAKIADNDGSKEELYAEIYSDMCTYIDGSAEKLLYVQKALKIYENLQNEGKDYSHNSYAMVLFNLGLILMQQGEYKLALEYAKKSSSIWDKILISKPDEQVNAYLSESKRLIAFLGSKIDQG